MSLLASGCVTGACHSILRAFGLPVGPGGLATVTDKIRVSAFIFTTLWLICFHPGFCAEPSSASRNQGHKRCGCGAERQAWALGLANSH